MPSLPCQELGSVNVAMKDSGGRAIEVIPANVGSRKIPLETHYDRNQVSVGVYRGSVDEQYNDYP